MKVAYDINDSNGKHSGYMIWCSACKEAHVFDSRWIFNGNYEKPTFNPSMLVHKNVKQFEHTKGKSGHRCHSFVTDGVIKYLGDCTHDMKNTSVKLEEF